MLLSVGSRADPVHVTSHTCVVKIRRVSRCLPWLGRRPTETPSPTPLLSATAGFICFDCLHVTVQFSVWWRQHFMISTTCSWPRARALKGIDRVVAELGLGLGLLLRLGLHLWGLSRAASLPRSPSWSLSQSPSSSPFSALMLALPSWRREHNRSVFVCHSDWCSAFGSAFGFPS